MPEICYFLQNKVYTVETCHWTIVRSLKVFESVVVMVWQEVGLSKSSFSSIHNFQSWELKETFTAFTGSTLHLKNIPTLKSTIEHLCFY